MIRALVAVALLASLPAGMSGQAPSVLRIRVTLTDAARTSIAIPRHVLLVSEDPVSSAPRRVVTGADGTVSLSLLPGRYIVESDQPVAFGGKGYWWTQRAVLPAGQTVVLELTADNAEVGAAPAPAPTPAPAAPQTPAPPADDALLLLPKSPESVVVVWTPTARASGVIIDASGLVVTKERAVRKASMVEVQLTPAVKVAARVLVVDLARDVAVLLIDPAVIASVRPLPLDCAAGSPPAIADVPISDVCEVVRAAQKARPSLPAPTAAHLPVESTVSLPPDAIEQAARSRGSRATPYMMSASDFDIAFLTPVIIYSARHARPPAGGRTGLDPTNFGDWSDYFEDAPPVLVIRVTPKFEEGFWTKFARGAAFTQGVALPPIKTFKPGFSRLRVFCGEAEVTPIHPFVLEQRLSATDAVREGLYVFDPLALGPACKTVKLGLFSEKAPAKEDIRAVDPALIERIWQDSGFLLDRRLDGWLM